MSEHLGGGQEDTGTALSRIIIEAHDDAVRSFLESFSNRADWARPVEDKPAISTSGPWHWEDHTHDEGYWELVNDDGYRPDVKVREHTDGEPYVMHWPDLDLPTVEDAEWELELLQELVAKFKELTEEYEKQKGRKDE